MPSQFHSYRFVVGYMLILVRIFLINQIAHRANVTNKVYKEDIEDIKSLSDQLIQPLLFLQSKCLQLKH